MSIQILLLPVIVLTFVAVFTRPDWVAVLVVRPVLQIRNGIHRGLYRLLAIHDHLDRRWFVSGTGVGIAFDLLCTIATSRDFGETSSLGFPFTFRTAGGFAYSVHYSWWAFVADIIAAMLLALVGGYAAIGVRQIWCDRRNTGVKPDRE